MTAQSVAIFHFLCMGPLCTRHSWKESEARQDGRMEPKKDEQLTVTYLAHAQS